MKITKNADLPRRPGPADWFTGTVQIETIAVNPVPSRLQAARVTFSPSARTAWHTHPLGQTLYVVSGICRVQLQGGPVQEAQPGDVVSIAPDELHWHGATPDAEMTHIAIQEADTHNVVVTWLEHVTDAEYNS